MYDIACEEIDRCHLAPPQRRASSSPSFRCYHWCPNACLGGILWARGLSALFRPCTLKTHTTKNPQSRNAKDEEEEEGAELGCCDCDSLDSDEDDVDGDSLGPNEGDVLGDELGWCDCVSLGRGEGNELGTELG
eukprot:scaffold23457_cov137-Skeletonema_marinoi.AAC.1